MDAASLVRVRRIPLLKTKLYIRPLRAGLVPRECLIARLNAGLWQAGAAHHLFGRKPTLLSAPAGFGKTTLLSE